MIVYTLKCAANHHFEAWFRNAASFDQQQAADLLECPVCGEHRVDKGLMTPNIIASKKREQNSVEKSDQETQRDPTQSNAESVSGDKSSTPSVDTEASAKSNADEKLPLKNDKQLPSLSPIVHATVMRAMARSVWRYIEATHEPVGSRFAEEVRAMHREEIDHRLVYGEATHDEIETLLDEGIDIASLPTPLPDDA